MRPAPCTSGRNHRNDLVGLRIDDGHRTIAVFVEPDFAVGTECDADWSALHGNHFQNAIGFRVEHHDAIVVAVRIIELVGTGLNRQVVPAVEHEIDLLDDLPCLHVVDNDSWDVGVLETDVELAAVVVERDAVRRRRGLRRRAGSALGERRGVRVKSGVSMRPVSLNVAASRIDTTGPLGTATNTVLPSADTTPSCGWLIALNERRILPLAGSSS